MLNIDKLELLQRYHDGEVNETEAAEVEALLTKDKESLEAMGFIDDMAELVRESIEVDMATVSFEGFWDGVKVGIDQNIAEEEKARARLAAPQNESTGVVQWLKELFVGHKGAWITAAATAAAVAIVLVAVQGAGDKGATETVVEKHYIYVDSVNKADPQSTVVINSMQDEGSAVIWLLPNAEENDGDQNDESNTDEDETGDDDVVIETEPL